MSNASDTRYVEPGRVTRRIVNPLANALSRRGVSVAGSRLLEIRGRSTGEWRTTTVNPLDLDGHRYLVAPRGETQWVRNLRVAGDGRLRIGRRVEGFVASELADDEKAAVLRAYLRRWKWEIGAFFDGVGPDATDEELLAIAPGYPVFRLAPAPPPAEVPATAEG